MIVSRIKRLFSKIKPTTMLPTTPTRNIRIAGVTSLAALLLTAFQGLPLWIVALVTILPWIPVFTLETAATYRHSHWLALFYVLAVTQTGHVLEHVAQMVQIHLLGTHPHHAHGIFGALDIEWVHVVWNTFVALAIIALLYRFRRNAWLWAAALIAVWHEIEHLYILSVYLSTGQAGTPGLLSRGGELSGGLPMIRPDLHFLYNLVETAPLVIAFVIEWRRTVRQQAVAHAPDIQSADRREPSYVRPRVKNLELRRTER